MGNFETGLNLSIDDNSKEIIQNIGKPLFTIMDVLDAIVAIPTAPIVYARDAIQAKLEYKKQLKNSFIQKADSKIAEIPAEKRIVPPRNLLGRFVETPEFYYEDEEISEFFANILASSIDFNKSQTVHPSFVNVVRELSPYDARLIRECLSKNNTLPICKIRCQTSDTTPFGNLKNFQYPSSGKDFLLHCYPIDYDYFELDLTSFSFSNLERLGLVYIDYDLYSTSIDKYRYLDENKEIIDKLSDFSELPLKSNEEIILCPGLLRLTEYGLNFIDVCCSSKHQSNH